MKILVCILSIWILVKNISYAIYEYRVNNNVSGSLTVAIINVVCFVFANVVLFLM